MALTSKMGKEETLNYLTTIFETPSSELPTSEFPALIFENIGIEVEEKHLGLFFNQLLGRDLRSRPRIKPPVVVEKTPRVIKPTVLSFAFADGGEVIINLKKVVEEVIPQEVPDEIPRLEMLPTPPDEIYEDTDSVSITVDEIESPETLLSSSTDEKGW
jgi:hypothetical protein